MSWNLVLISVFCSFIETNHGRPSLFHLLLRITCYSISRYHSQKEVVLSLISRPYPPSISNLCSLRSSGPQWMLSFISPPHSSNRLPHCHSREMDSHSLREDC